MVQEQQGKLWTTTIKIKRRTPSARVGLEAEVGENALHPILH